MRAYKANMIPGGVTPTINVSQYDNDYAVTVTLIEGAEIYTPPAGATIRVEGTKPDGHGFEYPCTYQGNVVTMPIYTQMTAVAGRFPIELVVYQSGLRVGSCNIIFSVERAPLGEGTDISETVIPDIIAGAQAQADAAAASATQAASSAASAETAKDAAMDAAQDAIDAAQELQTAIQFNAALIHETASGAVASFADGADNIPMQSVVAEITPVQSGTGDPSPTNIRPISGRTGMTVTRAGKNLLAPWMTSQTHNGVTYVVNADGTFTTSGTASANSQIISNRFKLPAGTYTLSGCPTGGSSSTYYLRALLYNGSTLVRILNSDYGTGGSFTIAAGEADFDIVVFSAIQGGNTVAKTWSPMIEVGSTATAYEPYAGQTYPVTWESSAGTVYGGTLDVVSGVLTVDRTMVAVKNMAWARTTSYAHPVFYVNQNGKAITYQKGACSFLRDIGRASIVSAQNFADYAENGDFALCSNNTQIFVRCDDVTDVSTFKTQFEDETFVYPLATPQTYQLTPTQVRTLLGGNTIYTDAGEVSVEYVADTKLYIDNKIAELQALVLEN